MKLLFTSDIQEQEIYQLLCSGTAEEKSKSLSVLYDRYASRIWHYCRRIVRDNRVAEDITQECFIILFQSAQEKKQLQNIIGFLLTTARNKCYNYGKLHKVRTELVQSLNSDENVQQPETTCATTIIAQAIESLPPEYREAITLRIYGDLSYNEIAEIINVPLATVRNRIARGKAQLLHLLLPLKEELKDFYL